MVNNHTSQQPGHIKQSVKSMRNVPENPYGEPKTTKSYYLTSTAIYLINTCAEELGIYATEVLERLARQIPNLMEALAQDPNAEDQTDTNT